MFKRIIKYIRTLAKITRVVPKSLIIFLLLYMILWFMFRNKEKKIPKMNEKIKELIWMFNDII